MQSGFLEILNALGTFCEIVDTKRNHEASAPWSPFLIAVRMQPYL